MGFYPIGDGLMANTQRPSNPALIHAVHVQAQGLMANFLGVACFACHWRVFSSAYFAHVALATRCIMTDFDLLFASFTVRTFYHPGILPYPHTLPLPNNSVSDKLCCPIAEGTIALCILLLNKVGFPPLFHTVRTETGCPFGSPFAKYLRVNMPDFSFIPIHNELRAAISSFRSPL